jgi:hypothetical protein
MFLEERGCTRTLNTTPRGFFWILNIFVTFSHQGTKPQRLQYISMDVVSNTMHVKIDKKTKTLARS